MSDEIGYPTSTNRSGSWTPQEEHEAARLACAAPPHIYEFGGAVCGECGGGPGNPEYRCHCGALDKRADDNTEAP